MKLRRRFAYIAIVVSLAFVIALAFIFIRNNIWIPIGLTCAIIAIGCPVWDIKFSDGTHDWLIGPTMLAIVGAVLSLFLGVDTYDHKHDAEAKARTRAIPPTIVGSKLASVLQQACDGHVAQLQAQMSDGNTHFWLVVCKDGTIHRVNPSDY